jgi:predicted DNA-binding transcriptional regulator AlpA
MIFIGADYAQHFKSVPKDGHTYIVEDPLRKHVHHWTRPDGSYERIEKRAYPYKAAGLPLTFHEKKVKGKRAKKNGLRVASDFGTGVAVRGAADAPPSICLIDIHRVMRITGFKKSFIYEQVDFPQPVRLGTSRRSSVRWVEVEIFAWVNALMSKRSNTVSM